jgi:hypothetical protein
VKIAQVVKAIKIPSTKHPISRFICILVLEIWDFIAFYDTETTI